MGSFLLRAEALLVFGALALCLDCRTAAAGDLFYQGSMAVSEQYNDNVTLSRSNTRDDFITSVTPAFDLGYSTRYSDWRLHAGATYENFAKNTLGDRFFPDASTNNRISLLGKSLYLRVVDVYRRVPLNYGYESLLTNQTNQNFLTLNPYLEFSPLSRSLITTGYSYQNVIYNRANAVDWQEHGVYLKASHELSAKLNGFVDVSYARTTTSDDVRSGRFTPTAGIDYNYGEGSHVFLKAGYSFINYDGEGSSGNPYWNAEINHSFGTVTAALKGEVVYNTDPQRSMTVEDKVEATLAKEIPRGSLALKPFYSSITETRTDRLVTRRYGLTADAYYDLSPRTRLTLALTGERDRGTLLIKDPSGSSETVENDWGNYFHLTADAQLSYALFEDLSLYGNYRYSTYLFGGSGLGSIRENRAILGVNKTFGRSATQSTKSPRS